MVVDNRSGRYLQHQPLQPSDFILSMEYNDNDFPITHLQLQGSWVSSSGRIALTPFVDARSLLGKVGEKPFLFN